MRGDRVEIVVDAGNEVRIYDIVATRNGRRVEVSTSRGVVEVTEVTRSGTPVRTGRFMANRVLALVEHPAEPRSAAGAGASALLLGRAHQDLVDRDVTRARHHPADGLGDVVGLEPVDVAQALLERREDLGPVVGGQLGRDRTRLDESDPHVPLRSPPAAATR